MRWIFRFILSAVVLMACGVASAYAQSCTIDSPCDQGAAYSAAASRSYAYAAEFNAAHPGTTYVGYKPQPGSCNNGKCYYRCVIFRQLSGTAGCLPQLDYYYFQSQTCSTRPALNSGVASSSGGGACNEGCLYGPGTTGQTYSFGGKTWFSTAGAAPTGAVCGFGDGTGKTVTEDDCVPQGTLTQCVKPDGRICTKASTGKMFCYGSDEAGAKSSGNESTVITPDGVEAKPPSTPPANGGEWVKAGEGTITVTKDGVTTTKTVTTYVSSYGPKGKNDGAEGDEGEGDDKGPTASTGVGCDQASFMCSDMSSVECNQLIQTWYLRCKGKQINGGANCDAPPVCEGNSVDCFVSHQLWQFRCEGKSEVDSDGTSRDAFDAQSASDGDGTDEPDAAHMPGNGETSDMGIWEERTVGGAEDLAKLDASGFLGGSASCPQLPSVSVGGRGSLSFNLSPICDLLRNVGILVMALAYWIAYRIIAKVRK